MLPPMLALLTTFSWQELRHHPWRSASAVVAVLLGVALGGERLPASAWVAMSVIVGGVALVSLVDSRRNARKATA